MVWVVLTFMHLSHAKTDHTTNVAGGRARALIPRNGGWATGNLKKCDLAGLQ
eukprot:COSAG01_NODE_39386_length_477_cov_0.812169_1_plen_51_part_10